MAYPAADHIDRGQVVVNCSLDCLRWRGHSEGEQSGRLTSVPDIVKASLAHRPAFNDPAGHKSRFPSAGPHLHLLLEDVDGFRHHRLNRL